jgi:hypothetical protein
MPNDLLAPLKGCVWACVAVLSIPLLAHDIITTKLTYWRDISPILEKRCTSCHSAGSAIPLTSYQEVRPWAIDIKDEVLTRSMPPWGAVKGFGDLLPDNSLTEEEITIIAAWVVGGAPAGKPMPRAAINSSSAAAETEKSADAVLIDGYRVLRSPLILTGIRPQPTQTVKSAKITATFPDRHVEPLLWLYEYDPKLQKVFLFRRPLRLPPGTIIESSAPVRFYLQWVPTTTSPVS